MEEQIEPSDEMIEYESPEQLNEQLVTLSLLPESRWKNLLNLDVIKVTFYSSWHCVPAYAPRAFPALRVLGKWYTRCCCLIGWCFMWCYYRSSPMSTVRALQVFGCSRNTVTIEISDWAVSVSSLISCISYFQNKRKKSCYLTTCVLILCLRIFPSFFLMPQLTFYCCIFFLLLSRLSELAVWGSASNFTR